MGLILYIWVHRLRLPSGRTKRYLLVLLLVLPLLTAAIPGRGSIEFGESIAWFNSARLLAIPLIGRLHMANLVVAIAALSVAVTVWQIARYGGFGRPRLMVPDGLPPLSPDESDVVAAIQRAYAQERVKVIALYLIRLVQSYNPVALWAFRDYAFEAEVSCDARAVVGRDPQVLARVLLKIYQATPHRDGPGRNRLRRRVDVLLAGGPDDAALPTTTVVAVAIFMLMVLPWIV